MWQKGLTKSSTFRESLEILEGDIQHANDMAATFPGNHVDYYIQMKLSYSLLAPAILFLFEWMDYSCTDTLPRYLGLLHILVRKVYVDGRRRHQSFSSFKERKATLSEFYGIIFPSLVQLEDEFLCIGSDDNYNYQRNQVAEVETRKNDREEDGKTTILNADSADRDECAICMETSQLIVLPICSHSLCIHCFHDWNERSQSCPFCRSDLKMLSSDDVWVLIGNDDSISTVVLARENLWRFYHYVENLPLAMAEANSFSWTT